jgi:hypothetical protein
MPRVATELEGPTAGTETADPRAFLTRVDVIATLVEQRGAD